jgi:tetratricopeptide (TPR) repeat protein
MRRAGVWIVVSFLSLLPALAADAAGVEPVPRALSAAERAGVELAAAYLRSGPQAWWERLAADAPLRRLGREVALDEIAVRAGPADGATWQLLTPARDDSGRAVFGLDFPSGLDETLILRLVNEGGWKIADIRTTIDPVALGPVVPASPSPPPEAPRAAPVSPSERGSPLLPLAGLGAALLALIIGAVGSLLLGRAGRNAAALGVGVLSVAVIAGALLWARNAAPGADAVVQGQARRAARKDLGTLAPLRAALASGTDRGEIERRLAGVPADRELRQVQDLWHAQYLLSEGDLTGAETLLRGVPETAARPLADLLRARLAFRRMQRDETGWRYEQALARGLDTDGLRMEAAIAKALTDESDRAEDLTLAVRSGSRLAEPWYVAAQLAAGEDRMEEAAKLLQRAWQMQPVTRAELFDNPLLAHLVVRPDLFQLFTLAVPEEARLAPTGPREPLVLPAGVQAATCGQSLRLAIGNAGNTAELLVPEGGQLAPADAVLEDADTWSRHEEAKALKALPSLAASAPAGENPGEIPAPRFLRLAEQAGGALAKQNRWPELLALTEPFAARIESAPPSLVRLRAKALHQLERDTDARQLLVRVAKSDIAGRRPTTATLFDLAELFAASGEYDTAIKLLEKADSQLPEPRGIRRRQQLAMDRNLAVSYASFRSEHFEVRYPASTGERYARQIAWVLEEERTRLLHWIPPPPAGSPARAARIEVHLFAIKDFIANFGGDIAIVGLFDGKVRVPFAELRSLYPKLVAILSHELAHALIAAATHSQAPHWIQEGLAQHIEMGTRRVNPLPDLARTGHALSFPTVDPILRGFAEEQLVELAYNEAAWSVAFIEERYGAAAVPRLLSAFAAGKTTEQALQAVCGVTPAAFDRAFWQWGTGGQSPRVRALEVRSYDGEYAALERREQENSAPPSTRLRDDVPTQARAHAADQRQRMADWYAAYVARTASVKRALKPVLQAYDGESVPEKGSIAGACRNLAAETRQALAAPDPWASPDPELNRFLRNAYILINDLGGACRSAQDAQVHALIDKVSLALGQAAQRLAPYGLKP